MAYIWSSFGGILNLRSMNTFSAEKSLASAVLLGVLSAVFVSFVVASELESSSLSRLITVLSALLGFSVTIVVGVLAGVAGGGSVLAVELLDLRACASRFFLLLLLSRVEFEAVSTGSWRFDGRVGMQRRGRDDRNHRA